MKGRGYIVYSIATTFLQLIAATGIVIWLLPSLGVHIPLWGLGLLLAAIGAWGVIGYKLSRDIVNTEPKTPSSAMIGCKGKVTTMLDPEGVVRVRGELWKARTSHATIEKNESIVVEGIEGMVLFVASSRSQTIHIQR
ncbi:MAG: NfeD family protein [Chloroflexota bacterium]|nr:NfeD family protein [Chloroflexota bacterium]